MVEIRHVGVFYNFKENKIRKNKQDEWQKLTQQGEKLVGYFKELGWTVNILRENNNDIYCLIEVHNEGNPRYFRSFLARNEWLETPLYDNDFWFVCQEVFKKNNYQLKKEIDCIYCWRPIKEEDLVVCNISLISGDAVWPRHKNCSEKVQRGETEEFWTTWKCSECGKKVRVSKIEACAFHCGAYHNLIRKEK